MLLFLGWCTDVLVSLSSGAPSFCTLFLFKENHAHGKFT
jgi:hypothetical protein